MIKIDPLLNVTCLEGKLEKDIVDKIMHPDPNEIELEHKLAKDVVDKITSLDPIKIEWIKLLIKQWLDALLPETRVKISIDVFKELVENGIIIDESDKVTGSYTIMTIKDQTIIPINGQPVWFNDIVMLLEKTS